MEEHSRCCFNNQVNNFNQGAVICCENSGVNNYFCADQPCDCNNTSFKNYSVSYQISHAKDVEKVVVSTTSEPRVKDLLCEIEKTFKIPFETQRLVYRGINLHRCPEKKLNELAIFPMSVLKLTGTRCNYQSSII